MTDSLKRIVEELQTSLSLPSISDVKMICEKAKELLIVEPNVLSLSSPISIVGEVHGFVFAF